MKFACYFYRGLVSDLKPKHCKGVDQSWRGFFNRFCEKLPGLCKKKKKKNLSIRSIFSIIWNLSWMKQKSRRTCSPVRPNWGKKHPRSPTRDQPKKLPKLVPPRLTLPFHFWYLRTDWTPFSLETPQLLPVIQRLLLEQRGIVFPRPLPPLAGSIPSPSPLPLRLCFTTRRKS